MAKDTTLSELEQKIERLKRDYDLFLAGQLRVEPVKLRREIEREIMQLTKAHAPSTVTKFRVKTLAHRFRSLETQIRNLTDLRLSKQALSEDTARQTPDSVIVDKVAIENPSVIVNRVRTVLKRALKRDGAGENEAPALNISPEAFCQVLVTRAKGMVGKDNVNAVRFHIVPGDKGPRVKGELLKGASEEKPEEPPSS